MEIAENRQKNSYPGLCSQCNKQVERQDGYLFKNTRYRNSKGYHIKCEDCYTGVTTKRVKEAERVNKPKTLSLPFAQKWCQSLELKTIVDEWGVYCEVYSNGGVILGLCPAFGGFQEWPNIDWCQEQASKLNGAFSDGAVNHICEYLTEKIQGLLAERELVNLIRNDSSPVCLISLSQVMAAVQYEWKHIVNALIKMQVMGKIQLRPTKTAVAKSLGVDLFEIRGIKYGFLKYDKSSL